MSGRSQRCRIAPERPLIRRDYRVRCIGTSPARLWLRHHDRVRAGVWLSAVAAALGLVAVFASAWLFIPAAASLVTALAWAQRRSVWWGVVAAAAHWTPLVLLAATAWDWIGLGLPLVPAALAQTIAVFLYGRSQPAVVIRDM